MPIESARFHIKCDGCGKFQGFINREHAEHHVVILDGGRWENYVTSIYCKGKCWEQAVEEFEGAEDDRRRYGSEW